MVTPTFRNPLFVLFSFLLKFSLLIFESVVQGGVAAGQTVSYVHFHLLPRHLQGDRFGGTRNGKVFNEREKQEGTLT